MKADDGRLRARYFDFEMSFEPNFRAYFFAKKELRRMEREEYDRIFYSAARILAELWEFGMRTQTEDYRTPAFWFAQYAFDAMAWAALENANRLDFSDYKNIEQRFPFLQGNYADRLSAYSYKDTKSGLDETGGALIRYLIEDHMQGGWESLYGLLRSSITDGDVMDSINTFVNNNDGDLYRGLQHAFPSFVAHQASLAFDQYKDYVSPDVWLKDSFGDCQDVSLSDQDFDQTKTVEILPFAARCFVVYHEARSSGWNGEIQLRTQLANAQPGDDRIGDVFISIAGSGKTSLDTPEYICNAVIQGGDTQRCLLIPSTPPSRDAEGQLQTYYNQPLESKSPKDKGWTVYLASYVPTDVRPGGVESRPGVNVELTWSLDAVLTDPGDLVDVNQPSGEFELIDMSTAVIDHGAKVGPSPIAAKRAAGVDVSWRSIFDGSASPIDGRLIDNAMSSFDTAFQFIDEAGDGFGVFLDPAVLQPGYTGPTDAIIAFAGQDGYLSAPDPQYQGKIEIIENTKDTFHFSIDEGFRMLPMSEWPRLLQESNPDLCKVGKRVSAKGKGALAFPPTRRSETLPDPTPSETYEGLQLIRRAAINERFGGALPTLNAPNQQGRAGDPVPASDQNRPVGIQGGTPAPGICQVRNTAGGCDCSCAAKSCLQTKQDSGSALPQETSCRLTCGKKWSQCGS